MAKTDRTREVRSGPRGEIIRGQPANDASSNTPLTGTRRWKDVLTLARSIVLQLADTHRSESTVRQYRKRWQRIRHDVPAALDKAGKRSTFHALRHAAKFGIAEELFEALRNFREAYRSGDERACDDLVSRMAELCERHAYVTFRHWDQESGQRRSKRRLLRFLPADWTDRMVRQASDDMDAGRKSYLMEICFLAVTGCRVGELLEDITAQANGGELVIRIVGIKATADSGQPWRILRIDPKCSLAADALWRVARQHGTVRPRRGVTQGAIREGVRRIGQRCFGRSDVSPILFRENIASRVKAEGWGPVVVAGVLGHVSTRTQSFYGMAQQASGASGLLRVETAREVVVHEAAHEKFPARDNEEDPKSE